MSQSRLKQKVRKNHDYQIATRMLDDLGLDHELTLPTGKGQHPRIVIDANGSTVEYVVACTPGPRINGGRVRNQLRRLLANAGVEV